MSNIATALKSEISRLARKEIKTETEGLKRVVAAYRSEIASLKRRMSQLERDAKRTARSGSKANPKADETADVEDALRFRAAGFAKHRQRLGLSAADCGRLLGVSALSVYKWEKGEARPRRTYMPAIAALRGLGKREAQARLAELG